MFTRLAFISTIQGCSIIFQGLARRFGCFSKLCNVSDMPLLSNMCINLPALDKIFKVVAPVYVHLWLILEFRYVLSNNVCQ